MVDLEAFKDGRSNNNENIKGKYFYKEFYSCLIFLNYGSIIFIDNSIFFFVSRFIIAHCGLWGFYFFYIIKQTSKM